MSETVSLTLADVQRYFLFRFRCNLINLSTSRILLTQPFAVQAAVLRNTLNAIMRSLTPRFLREFPFFNGSRDVSEHVV